jgi:hypothetical protein
VSSRSAIWWFRPVDVPLGFGQLGRPPVLMAGYSRMIAAVMLPSTGDTPQSCCTSSKATTTITGHTAP